MPAEGEDWQDASDHTGPVPVITTSPLQRFISREEENVSARVIAALRDEASSRVVGRV